MKKSLQVGKNIFSSKAGELLHKLKLSLQSALIMQMKINAREALYENKLEHKDSVNLFKLSQTLKKKVTTLNEEYLGKKLG